MSQTQASATIDAPLADVNAVISDLPNYPSWSSAITAVKVIESDAQGRATKVEMKVNSGPLRDTVILDYEWSAAPEQISFSLSDADLLTGMDGFYKLEADGDETVLTYALTVELNMPVPAMMREKAEKSFIDQVLKELKARIEG
jgi:carbon monoxide dehydrogenase subunit G